MSRIAKSPIVVPIGIKVLLKKDSIIIIGKKEQLKYRWNKKVRVIFKDSSLFFFGKDDYGWENAGTTRAIINNMIIGVTIGFKKKIKLVGVGYKAVLEKKKVLSMSLGFSHLVKYVIPAGIIVECNSQTEITIKGANKQMVGQVAADLRSYRVPESYKGKGVRYHNEIIKTKEAKKK